ncbi:MAG TPA: kynureninase [Rhizomicrobium sp.]|jgi:kynureninase
MLSREECEALDTADPLAAVRARFVLPEGEIYLDGNSLGALGTTVAPRMARAIEEEWGKGLIRSWNEAGWYPAARRVGAAVARLIGAAPDEVIVADSTSVNLFKVLVAALRLRPTRRKVLVAAGDFPTDLYIAAGVAQMMGVSFATFDPHEPASAIDDETAAVVLTQVNYRSGQLYDMERVTAAAHARSALAIFDLSHSAGVMKLELNKAKADFAVGCTYKYLNGGPGAPAYIFAASRHHATMENPITGWFGHADPFRFAGDFAPADGMARMLSGTPPTLSLLALEEALKVFEDVDLDAVRDKSKGLTDLFMRLSDDMLTPLGFVLASPRDAKKRGSQVSLTHEHGYAIMQALIARGITGDFRAPDIVRFGFVPLYIRYVDVFDTAIAIRDIMQTRAWDTVEFRTRKAVT